MKIIPTLIALSLSLFASASAFAAPAAAPKKLNVYCQSAVTSDDGYSYRIKLEKDFITIAQSSTLARFAPIVHAIEASDTFIETSEAPEFSCSTAPKGRYNYSATIQVYADHVVLLQVADNARYAPLTFLIKKDSDEGEDPAPSQSFSCEKPASGEWGYRYAITIQNDVATILQSSMIARYVPITHKIQALDSFEIPAGEPKFSCVSEPAAHQYRAEIQVFADKIVVLQSSEIARYAPLVFAIVAE